MATRLLAEVAGPGVTMDKALLICKAHLRIHAGRCICQRLCLP